MVSSKIHLGYSINKSPPLIYTGNKLSGKITLENIGNKNKNLKKVFIRLVSRYERHKRDSEAGILVSKWVWVHYKKTLREYHVEHPKKINAGERVDISFTIQLPFKWTPRVGKKYRNWQVALEFFLKTGLRTQPTATCILPVKGSKIPPSNIFLSAEPPSRIICHHCGKENLSTSKFCENCGVKLLKVNLCKSCGNEFSRKVTYCPFCGAQVFETPSHQ